MIRIIIAAVFLAGCTNTEYIRVPVEVEIPVSVPCAPDIDPPRAYATSRLTRRSSDGDIIRAMAVEIEERGVVENELRAILAGCSGV